MIIVYALFIYLYFFALDGCTCIGWAKCYTESVGWAESESHHKPDLRRLLEWKNRPKECRRFSILEATVLSLIKISYRLVQDFEVKQVVSVLTSCFSASNYYSRQASLGKPCLTTTHRERERKAAWLGVI